MTNKRIIRTFLAMAVAAATWSPPSLGRATPTSNHTHWSWGSLYVNTYQQHSDGTVLVSFERNGGLHTHWRNQAGTNLCPTKPDLRVHPSHPRFDELTKLLLAAGLAKKPLHVWYEGVSGTCWIKTVKATL